MIISYPTNGKNTENFDQVKALSFLREVAEVLTPVMQTIYEENINISTYVQACVYYLCSTALFDS